MSTLSAALKGINRGREKNERQEQIKREEDRRNQLFKLTMDRSKREQAAFNAQQSFRDLFTNAFQSAMGIEEPSILAGDQGVDVDTGLPKLRQADGKPDVAPSGPAISRDKFQEFLSNPANLFLAKQAGFDLTGIASLEQRREGEESRGVLGEKRLAETTRQNLATRQFAEKKFTTEQAFRGGEIGRQVIKSTISGLPESRKEAIRSAGNIGVLDELISLAESGKVTGKGGQIKAALAPFAEILGIKFEGLSNAQLFQKMTRAQIGQFRLEIIGPGPVSEAEQNLMAQVGGGGGVAQAASIRLLELWRQISEEKVNIFNSDLESVKDIQGISNRFKPVVIPGKKPSLRLGQDTRFKILKVE